MHPTSSLKLITTQIIFNEYTELHWRIGEKRNSTKTPLLALVIPKADGTYVLGGSA
jgi:hypothetical protein